MTTIAPNTTSNSISEFIQEDRKEVSLLESLVQKVDQLAKGLEEANAKIEALAQNVQTKFSEVNFFECDGHETVVGHYDILKKAHRKGKEAVVNIESQVFNKKATYKVISRKDSPEEYEKYSENQSLFERAINYKYVTVLTQYHHDNVIGCAHYQEYLKSKDITQQ